MVRVGRRGWRFWGVVVAVAIAILCQGDRGSAWESHYAVTGRAPFNQPGFFPIGQVPPSDRFLPTAAWFGRLILPSVAEQGQTDWVWLVVEQAPPTEAALVGQKVRLEWSPEPAVQDYVATVTQDVNFTPAVVASLQQTGNLYPVRLNGRSRVGPLQAIAGARPKDDVIVSLPAATVTRSPAGQPILQIATEPAMDTGRYTALVKIVAPIPTSAFIPQACPGGQACQSELWRVQHYNPATQQFDGPEDTIRIPQQPVDGFGVFASTPRDIDKSPAGTAGWYISGAPDQTGLFTVQAIAPRSLLQLQPQKVLRDLGQGLDWINYDNWKDTEQRQGTLQTTLIDPVAPSPATAIAQWQEGDRALVMHLFGGRGGQQGEPSAFGTVTGHFSYGWAQVVRDRFTQELRFDVNYQQVYATNIEGFISGLNTWRNYMGNLQRGWLGTRPVSDIIVKLDVISQDYDFGGIKLSPLDEFLHQLQIINARYRTGDGTGAANVTAATSCVQDSNQALFLTIQHIRETVESSPAIQQWWSSHPQDPTVQRFERLIALGDDLQQQLLPFGLVRRDWQSNAQALSGTGQRSPEFVHTGAGTANLLSALASWRTILPRQAQDELSILFLRHGATLWFLRTNQVGGHNPDILPVAPTQAFARWKLPGTEIAPIAVLFTRILGAIALPTTQDWWVTGLALLGYGAIALPLGLTCRFLKWQLWCTTAWHYPLLALRLLIMPALVEELVFRVLLLPYPRAGITPQLWWLWAGFSLILFILYHPLNAKTLYRRGDPTFLQPTFLTLTGLLGAACTIAYCLTGSLLTITLIHWVVVTVWLVGLGGMAKLHPEELPTKKPSTSFPTEDC